MPSCYLTIDDSPSDETNDLVDYLSHKNIPAILFVRGDLLEKNPDPIIRAIQKGLVIGNHAYAHKPHGDMTYEQAIENIQKCDSLIDKAYAAANIKRQGRYFRFPYLDRGNGDRIERHFEQVSDIDINADPKVAKIQEWLTEQGFNQPFQTDHPLYQNTSIAQARDCLMTFTSFDWKLGPRHARQWDCRTVKDLINRIDGDQYLSKTNGSILIFHDEHGLLENFKTLVDHMMVKGYEFLPIRQLDMGTTKS